MSKKSLIIIFSVIVVLLLANYFTHGVASKSIREAIFSRSSSDYQSDGVFRPDFEYEHSLKRHLDITRASGYHLVSIILLFVGLLILTFGYFWLMFVALTDSIPWLIFSFGFPPILLLYGGLYYDKAKKPLLICLAGLGLAAAGALILKLLFPAVNTW